MSPVWGHTETSVYAMLQSIDMDNCRVTGGRGQGLETMDMTWGPA